MIMGYMKLLFIISLLFFSIYRERSYGKLENEYKEISRNVDFRRNVIDR